MSSSLFISIGAPGSWAFGHELELTQLVPLDLRPLGLDWDYATSFLGPPSSDGRLPLLSCEPILKSLSIYLSSIYLSPLVLFLWKTLTNTDLKIIIIMEFSKITGRCK
jgi:hypothetical protein